MPQTIIDRSDRSSPARMKRQADARLPLAITQVATTETPFKGLLLPIIIVMVGLIGLISFAPKMAKAPPVQAISPMEQHQALVQEVYDALANDRLDLALIEQLFTPNFQYHLLDRTVTIDGPVGVKAPDTIYLSLYAHRYHTPKTIIPVGEMVVTHWTTDGLAYDPYTPFSLSTDRPIARSGTTIWRIVEGKIVEVWLILDI